MKTVALFVSNARAKGERNAVYTRSMRKIAFVDNRHQNVDSTPGPNEYWMVDIVRENPSQSGGCLIVQPLFRILKDQIDPLIHGMYDMHDDGDAVIITPHDQSRYWVLRPTAKKEILAASPDARTLVINQGGEMWVRRKPADDVLLREAKLVLQSIGTDSQAGHEE